MRARSIVRVRHVDPAGVKPMKNSAAIRTKSGVERSRALRRHLREYCEWYPEFCDDIDDCEQYPELCDPNYTYCVPEWAGDNDCDTYNNTAECGWDGGDCCVSTVGIYSSSRTYECLDPNACENSEAFCPSRDSVFCEGSPEYCYGYCLGNPDLCCPEGQSECPDSIVNARSRLTPESFVGVYERRPIENDWHLVEVVLEDGQLYSGETNRATMVALLRGLLRENR